MSRTSLMRLLVLPTLLLSLPACQIDSVDFGDDQVDQLQQASVGGVPAGGQDHYEAIAAITILRPLGDNAPDGAVRDEFIYCSGVLLDDKTVLTAAACLAANLEADQDPMKEGEFLDSLSVKIEFGLSPGDGTAYSLDASYNNGTSVKGLTMHRYFEKDGSNNVALLRLSESTGIPPVSINSEALVKADLDGQMIELLGYGKDGLGVDEDKFSSRNTVDALIVDVRSDRIVAGEETATSCGADGGGPGFYTFDTEPVVITINDRQRDCALNTIRQRVDLYAADFITPFIKEVQGCADCQACDYNGMCEEDCPTRDWDCELGSFAGEACQKNGDCEQGGGCVVATDDPGFMYCSKPCTEEDTASCPSSMTCVSGSCAFVGISPGSQGASCVAADNCRSGICEDLLCAFPCDPGDANACDTAGGFLCLTATDGSNTNVCRINLVKGGGGFCSAGGSGSGRNGLLIGLGLVLLAWSRSRNRERTSVS